MAEDSTGLCIDWTEDCLSGRPRRARRRCPGRGASRERRRRPQGAGPPPNIFSCTAHYILLQLLLSTPPLLSHHLLHRGRCGRLIHPSALSRRACSSRCALLSARRTGPRPSRLRSRCFNRDVSSPVELHATRRAPAGQEFLLPSPVTSVVITPARQQRVRKKKEGYIKTPPSLRRPRLTSAANHVRRGARQIPSTSPSSATPAVYGSHPSAGDGPHAAARVLWLSAAATTGPERPRRPSRPRLDQARRPHLVAPGRAAAHPRAHVWLWRQGQWTSGGILLVPRRLANATT